MISEFLRQRGFAYKRVFDSEDGKQVLEDLARFCRAESTCFHTDPRVTALLEGRREVWLRIQEHLNKTAEELQQLYNGGTNV